MVQRITGYNFRWESVPYGDCCWKEGRFIATRSYKKKLDEIYSSEIHTFAKMYKADYTAPLGLLPDHVASIFKI